MGEEEIVRASEVQVVNRELYSSQLGARVPGAGGDVIKQVPQRYGVLDLRLGANDRFNRCETCHQLMSDCTGHWGYLKLHCPVFHIGYFKNLLKVLTCVCKVCGALLVGGGGDQSHHSAEVRSLASKMRRLKNEPLMKKALFLQIHKRCQSVRSCPVCGERQGLIRKEQKGQLDQFMKVHHVLEDKERNVGSVKKKVIEDLNPIFVQQLLRLVSPLAAEVLDIGSPDKFIVSNVIVPPNTVRPSTSMGDAGSNEDDLTMLLGEIADLNNIMRSYTNGGHQSPQLLGSWEFLQLQSARFVNSEAPGIAQLLTQNNMKPARGVCQRLKGKEGRFRGNLSGKRVDFSGRTVISPDPNCRVSEVVVPEYIAKKMTYPQLVFEANLEEMREVVLKGADTWPGASYVNKREGGKTALRHANRRHVAEALQVGDVVERHMRNGDVVLFNRQPSLHRMSIMAHRARVMPWRTLRFNECVCAPYNADFDGDEMNIHLPQTEEARAEALHLMGVVRNLVTPKNGEPLIAATQDFLSGTFLLTHKDAFLTRGEFCQACTYMTDGCMMIDMPPPAIVKPVEFWTGKQVINVLLRPNQTANVMVNFELKEREYDAANKQGEMCRLDGYVLVRNSELLCGAMGKKTLGGSKAGLFFHLLRDNSAEVAAECMNRIAKLAARWFANRGFTIGIDDVTPSPQLTAAKKMMLEEGYAAVDNEIINYKKGHLQPNPGCTLEQTLEGKVKGILDELRNSAGKECQESLPAFNKPLIMFMSGAKGQLINIAQMIACVGQQNVGGQRIQNGFVDRTLPHFPMRSTHGRARGFVANSFYTGLEPDEFFFHTMSGREGLVDTAVKTAETGYMQRRLMKALEDLSVRYDRTVRTSDGQMVQFVYGDDGLNPSMMEDKNKPMVLDKVFRHISSMTNLNPFFTLTSLPHHIMVPSTLQILDFFNKTGIHPPGSPHSVFSPHSAPSHQPNTPAARLLKWIIEELPHCPIATRSPPSLRSAHTPKSPDHPPYPSATHFCLLPPALSSEIRELAILPPAADCAEVNERVSAYLNAPVGGDVSEASGAGGVDEMAAAGVHAWRGEIGRSVLSRVWGEVIRGSRGRRMSNIHESDISKACEVSGASDASDSVDSEDDEDGEQSLSDVTMAEGAEMNEGRKRVHSPSPSPDSYESDSPRDQQAKRRKRQQFSEVAQPPLSSQSPDLVKPPTLEDGLTSEGVSDFQRQRLEVAVRGIVSDSYVTPSLPTSLMQRLKTVQAIHRNSNQPHMNRMEDSFRPAPPLTASHPTPSTSLSSPNSPISSSMLSAPSPLSAMPSPSPPSDSITQLQHQTMGLLRCHVAVYEWLKPINQFAPLLPIEMEVWAAFILMNCSVPLPVQIMRHQAVGASEAATHQAKTAVVKEFLHEVRDWIKHKASEVAAHRRENGEPGGDGWESLVSVLSVFRAKGHHDARRRTVMRGYEFTEVKEKEGFMGGRRVERGEEGEGCHTNEVKVKPEVIDDENTLIRPDAEPTRVSDGNSRESPHSRAMWITVRHLLEFIRLAWRKYVRALSEPGDAVGAMGAQSIGEPGTQMTLKTFHFAGVASMNVTLGVPRIKEIINAAQNIQTPIIDVPFVIEDDYSYALMVKGRIERTYLSEIACHVKEVYSASGAHLSIKLDREIITRCFLDITAETVRDSILNAPLKKTAGVAITPPMVEVLTDWKLSLSPPKRDGLLFDMQSIKAALLNVVVKGLPNIKRGVIKHEATPSGANYSLAVEGLGLMEVMGVAGVKGTQVTSNHVMEVKKVLGIEAARGVIISEIQKCMDAYSMEIDIRHIQLLGEVMCFRGDVLGISRFGIQRMRASTLMLASFEETSEHLFEAATHQRRDPVRGVSECIIMGKHVNLGTGAFDLLYDPKAAMEGTVARTSGGKGVGNLTHQSPPSASTMSPHSHSAGLTLLGRSLSKASEVFKGSSSTMMSRLSAVRSKMELVR
eukprot:GHVN01028506.1.p1 GENE.GHVN01028506.1~~GHVN01028506.1.p1  ORF type:complete len:2000 (-),score=433.87 GHVN01028506.1:415-6282(-)